MRSPQTFGGARDLPGFRALMQRNACTRSCHAASRRCTTKCLGSSSPASSSTTSSPTSTACEPIPTGRAEPDAAENGDSQLSALAAVAGDLTVRARRFRERRRVGAVQRRPRPSPAGPVETSSVRRATLTTRPTTRRRALAPFDTMSPDRCIGRRAVWSPSGNVAPLCAGLEQFRCCDRR